MRKINRFLSLLLTLPIFCSFTFINGSEHVQNSCEIEYSWGIQVPQDFWNCLSVDDRGTIVSLSSGMTLFKEVQKNENSELMDKCFIINFSNKENAEKVNELINSYIRNQKEQCYHSSKDTRLHFSIPLCNETSKRCFKKLISRFKEKLSSCDEVKTNLSRGDVILNFSDPREANRAYKLLYSSLRIFQLALNVKDEIKISQNNKINNSIDEKLENNLEYV